MLWVRHYVMKFVSVLRQVGGFLQVLRFPPPIKLTATIDMTEILFPCVPTNMLKMSFYLNLLTLTHVPKLYVFVT